MLARSPFDEIKLNSVAELKTSYEKVKVEINDLIKTKQYLKLLGLGGVENPSRNDITKKFGIYSRRFHQDIHKLPLDDDEARIIIADILESVGIAKTKALDALARKAGLSPSMIAELTKRYVTPESQESYSAVNEKNTPAKKKAKVTHKSSSSMGLYSVQSASSSVMQELRSLSPEKLQEISSKHLWDHKIAELYSHDEDVYMDILNYLKENADYDVNIPGPDGNYILHHATRAAINADNDNLILLDLLLTRFGADPNVLNADRQTPLHIAFEKYVIKKSAGNMLMEHGSEYKRFPDKNNMTPLDVLEKNYQSSTLYKMKQKIQDIYDKARYPDPRNQPQ